MENEICIENEHVKISVNRYDELRMKEGLLKEKIHNVCYGEKSISLWSTWENSYMYRYDNHNTIFLLDDSELAGKFVELNQKLNDCKKASENMLEVKNQEIRQLRAKLDNKKPWYKFW